MTLKSGSEVTQGH